MILTVDSAYFLNIERQLLLKIILGLISGVTYNDGKNMNKLRNKYDRVPFAARTFWVLVLFVLILIVELLTLHRLG